MLPGLVSTKTKIRLKCKHFFCVIPPLRALCGVHIFKIYSHFYHRAHSCIVHSCRLCFILACASFELSYDKHTSKPIHFVFVSFLHDVSHFTDSSRAHAHIIFSSFLILSSICFFRCLLPRPPPPPPPP